MSSDDDVYFRNIRIKGLPEHTITTARVERSSVALGETATVTVEADGAESVPTGDVTVRSGSTVVGQRPLNAHGTVQIPVIASRWGCTS